MALSQSNDIQLQTISRKLWGKLIQEYCH